LTHAYLLKEEDDRLTLEDGSGFLILEDDSGAPHTPAATGSGKPPLIFGFQQPKIPKLIMPFNAPTTFSNMFPANGAPIVKFTFNKKVSTLVPIKTKVIGNPIILEKFTTHGVATYIKKFFTEGSIKNTSAKGHTTERKRKRKKRKNRYEFIERLFGLTDDE